MLNYDRLRKEKVEFWDILFGKPLVVKVYHIISSEPDIPVSQLKTLKALPSQFIMDNICYYGECENIGYEKLCDNELDFPIMYGVNIDLRNSDKIIFQQGLVYKTVPFKRGEVIGYFETALKVSFHRNRVAK